TVRVGDSVALGNGDDFNNSVEANMHWPTNIVCSGASPPYTGCRRREMAVVNIGTNCDVPMNRESTVVGFVRVVIVGTNPGGVDESLTVYIDCSAVSGTAPAGCATFGFGAKKLRLVQ